MIEVTTSAMAAHPFLHGMQPRHLDALAASTSDVMFPAGYRIFEDGGYAGRFWLIRSGHVTLDLNVSGEGPMAIEDIGMGGMLGCSRQFPPYRWAFGAVTVGPCETFEFDAPAVRACCEADPVLGYELTQRVAHALAGRLQATRMRLLARPGRPASLYS
jgi:CRP/FNR family cyclic AMP-dependent transcriptional regulator